VSLGVVVKVPDGLVLAAESRVSVTLTLPSGASYRATFDNATKVLAFGPPHTYVGVVTYGVGAIADRTAHSFVPEFEATLPAERLSVRAFAEELQRFFLEQWAAAAMPPTPTLNFRVAGFDEDDPYGRVWGIDVPTTVTPFEFLADHFGAEWGGQRAHVDRLFAGFDPRLLELLRDAVDLKPLAMSLARKALDALDLPVPWNALPLQDGVDLAIFGIRATIISQTLSLGDRGCGGPIDVAVITRRDGLHWVQRKALVGESLSREVDIAHGL
jgi:hypothetical protein